MSGYAYSDDKLAYLYFPKGVQALDKDGHGLKKVSIKPLADNIPAPPPSAAAFSLPYEFGPGGAAFTPGATLTLVYDPAKLPSSLNPANLVLMTWDPAGKAWIAAEGAVVDTSAHTVSVTVTHLGLYQLFGTLKPASFSLRSVEVSPGEVNIGEAVTVRASVANTGNLEGEYTVTLKVNGEVAATQKVALAGGGSTTVSFTVTRDAAGTYEVDVNGQQAAFNVWAVGPVEPEFVLKSLAVFPYETTYGEAAVISVVAENKGDAAVTRTVVFKIDGTVMSTQEVSLAPRSEKTVEYTAANCEPGVHAVDVNYLQASFNVRPLLIAPPPSDINWYLIGLIIFAVTTLSSTVGFRLKSRTQYIPPVPPPVRRRTNGSGY